MKSSKENSRIVGICAIASLAVLIAMFTTQPVIDPADPRFDPKQFRLSHYSGNNEKYLTAALLKMFPPGTPKSYVDSILVENAGMKIEPVFPDWARDPPEVKKKFERTKVYTLMSVTGLSGRIFNITYDDHENTQHIELGKNRLY